MNVNKHGDQNQMQTNAKKGIVSIKTPKRGEKRKKQGKKTYLDSKWGIADNCGPYLAALS